MLRSTIVCLGFLSLVACSGHQAPPSEFVAVSCGYFAYLQFDGDAPVELTHLAYSREPGFKEHLPAPEELTEDVTYILVRAAGRYEEDCYVYNPDPARVAGYLIKKGDEETVRSFYLRFCRYRGRWLCNYTSPIGGFGSTHLEYDGCVFYHSGPASRAKPFDPAKETRSLALQYKD